MKRRNKILSILLTFVMIIGMLPASAIPAMAVSYGDPTYSTPHVPELILLNAYTGNNEKYYQNTLQNDYYNAVAASKFNGFTKYTRLSDSGTYDWDGFSSTNIAYLQDKYAQLKGSFSLTLSTNSHKHSWGFLGIYSANITSYMNAEMYLDSDTGKGGRWTVATQSGHTKQSKIRQGNMKYYDLPTVINGKNTNVYSINGQRVNNYNRDKLKISFVNSTLYYDSGKKTCSCGGTAESVFVGFYDGTQPSVRKVELLRASDNKATTFFKANDKINIVLEFNEALRFADHNKSGKGNVYIGLKYENSTKPLYAHLTELSENKLVFSYDVPDDGKLYTVTGLDFTAAPNGGKALVDNNAGIELVQLCQSKTYSGLPNPTDASKPLGFSKTTSYVTDMAGNAISSSAPAASFYIDCEAPYIAKAVVSAETNNSAVKEALGKTTLSPNSANYEDNSDSYLGIGDTLAFTLYFNERINQYISAEITTNLYDPNRTNSNDFVTININHVYPGICDAKGIDTGLGRGASNGKISYISTAPLQINPAWMVDDPNGVIRIKSITFNNGNGNYFKDLSDNMTSAAPAPGLDKEYRLDIAAPTVQCENGVQSALNGSFYVPFMVKENSNSNSSGVAGLPSSLRLERKDSVQTWKFEYAITNSADTPSEWKEGVFGTELPFTQTGLEQYLHVKPIDGEAYDFSGGSTDTGRCACLNFKLTDYAGNVGSVTGRSIYNVSLDRTAPSVSVTDVTRHYDNSSNKGVMTVLINAADSSEIGEAKYKWFATDTDLPDPKNRETWGLEDTADPWKTANKSEGAFPASADIPSQTAFSKALFFYAKDAAGNETMINLGQYSYSLLGINYTLEYDTGIITEPRIAVNELPGNGKLLFVLQYKGENSIYAIYADAANPSDNVFEAAGNNALHGASLDTTDGMKYELTPLTDEGKDNFITKHTGDLYVTVYSGANNDIVMEGNHSAVTVTGNAKKESFVLHVSRKDNTEWYVFTDPSLTVPSTATESVTSVPWHVEDGFVASTLEGAKAQLNLGEDKNGWGFADINWGDSELKIKNWENQNLISACSLGSGAVQEITLPAVSGITSGKYSLEAYLKRNSFDSAYNIGSSLFCIDTTEPGSLSLGMLIKEDEVMTGSYEELSYEPGATIYIPTVGYKSALSVEALDSSGNTVWLTENDGVYYGAFDILAWNVSKGDNEKISLSTRHFTATEEYGKTTITQDGADDNPLVTVISGKRALFFGKTTDATDYTLGVTPDTDNVIALQIIYANGKKSEIKYITVHPVSMNITGEIDLSHKTEDERNWVYQGHCFVTTDPGEAKVYFKPSAGLDLSGVRLFCQAGGDYIHSGVHVLKMYGGFGKEIGEMTRQSDGSYVFEVPEIDAEGYLSAAQAYAADSVNNPPAGRYNGIYVPKYAPDEGVKWENAIKVGGERVGHYVVYAKDNYGNMQILGETESAIAADASAPLVEPVGITGDPGYLEAQFTIRDDSLFSGGNSTVANNIFSGAVSLEFLQRPVTLTLSYDDAYAEQIGAEEQSLSVTLDPAYNGTTNGFKTTWHAEETNPLGIYELSARYNADIDGDFYTFGPKDVWLTVDVKALVPGKIATNTNLKLNLAVTDAHGNTSEPVSISGAVTGAKPQVSQAVYKKTDGTGSDHALFITFSQPIKPAESWINRSIKGYSTEWHDAFPIWKDGTWTIEYSDVFGTHYVDEITLNSVFGDYGIDLGFSTLGYVAPETGLTITAVADSTAGEHVELVGGYESAGGGKKINANGDYEIRRWLDSNPDEVDTLRVNLNNIISGAPSYKLYFYFEEFGQDYEDRNVPANTATKGAVTVRYETDRETQPNGSSSKTFKFGDSDLSYSFEYYDAATKRTYPIEGSLAAYGITLAEPEVPFVDTEAPRIESITLWKQTGSGFTQVESIAGNNNGTVNSGAFLEPFRNAGRAQSFSLVVNASDYSDWKIVAKPTENEVKFNSSSDEISGLTIKGNTITLDPDVSDLANQGRTFYTDNNQNLILYIVDKQNNRLKILIPISHSYLLFDTTAPEIFTDTETSSLYEKVVYLKATDTGDNGDHSTITISGDGVVKNTNPDGSAHPASDWPYKRVFTDNVKNATVFATDAAGNMSSVTFSVSGIDVSAPKLNVTWAPCFSATDADGNTTLNHASPTLGPVNTEVVAIITSDKEIKELSAKYTVGDAAEQDCVFTDRACELGWGRIEYSGLTATVRFTSPNDAVTVTLSFTAPNSRSDTTTITLNKGVIDTVPATAVPEKRESKREGCTAAYKVDYNISFNEDVYCMNGGEPGTVYNGTNLFTVTFTDSAPQTYIFADKAGNITRTTLDPGVVDSVAPTLDVTVPEGADVTNGSVTVSAKTDEECTLSAAGITIPAMLPETDPVTGKTFYKSEFQVSQNGAFELTATDKAGNVTGTVFRISSIDRTQPTISFDSSTFTVREGSDIAVLDELLRLDSGSVHFWDNSDVVETSARYDISQVNINAPGIYPVVYTVSDAAGNEGTATRYVKVVSKDQLLVEVDGAITEEGGTLGLKTGAHTLSVSGLRKEGAEDEPYTLRLVKGIWSAGQMKRVSDGIAVSEGGGFTLDGPGYYTLYILTQSRQTYRTLLYADK